MKNFPQFAGLIVLLKNLVYIKTPQNILYI